VFLFCSLLSRSPRDYLSDSICDADSSVVRSRDLQVRRVVDIVRPLDVRIRSNCLYSTALVYLFLSANDREQTRKLNVVYLAREMLRLQEK